MNSSGFTMKATRVGIKKPKHDAVPNRQSYMVAVLFNLLMSQALTYRSTVLQRAF